MRLRLLMAVFIGQLSVLGFQPGVGAADGPSIAVTPSHGACSDELTVVGSGFAPDSDVTITGIFDLIESTALGPVTAGSDGGFVFPIPREGMPEHCPQGRKLLISAELPGDSAGVSQTRAFFVVDGPWELEVSPAVTDCADLVVVRGAGFEAGQQIFLAWGEVDYFVEADFGEIGSAETDASGEFETSIDVSRRCSEDGEWGIYAWPVDGRGDRGWAEAVLQVRSAATPDVQMSPTSEVVPPTSVAGVSGLTESVAQPGEAEEPAASDSTGRWFGLVLVAIALAFLLLAHRTLYSWLQELRHRRSG